MMARVSPAGELAEVDGQGMLVKAPKQSFRIPDTMHLLEAADMSVDTFVDEDSELWLVQLPDPKKVGRQHLSGVHWRVDSGALEESGPCQVATFMTLDGGRQVVTTDGAGSSLFCVLPGSGDQRQSVRRIACVVRCEDAGYEGPSTPLLTRGDNNVILDLEPPPTTQTEEEPTNPLPRPILKKKKRQRAVEEGTTSPKAKKMKVKGDSA